jgi:hypothetical protein
MAITTSLHHGECDSALDWPSKVVSCSSGYTGRNQQHNLINCTSLCIFRALLKNLTAAKSVVPLSPPSTGRLGDSRTAAPPTTPSGSGISVEDPTAVATDMQKLWVRPPKPHLSSSRRSPALCRSLWSPTPRRASHKAQHVRVPQTIIRGHQNGETSCSHVRPRRRLCEVEIMRAACKGEAR